MGRCLVVWTAGSCALVGPALVVARMLGHSWSSGPSPSVLPLDLALAELSGAVLVGCAGWAWLALTATVLEALRASPGPTPGASPASRAAGAWRLPGRLRHLVLGACGVALASGLAGPALAAPHPRQHAAFSVRALAGLPLPERAVAPAHAVRTPRSPEPAPRPPARRTVRVRPGDCLWSLAVADLPAGSSTGDVARRWRQIYLANRSVIGADPGLLLPGQLLVLPPPHLDPSSREEPR